MKKLTKNQKQNVSIIIIGIIFALMIGVFIINRHLEKKQPAEQTILQDSVTIKPEPDRIIIAYQDTIQLFRQSTKESDIIIRLLEKTIYDAQLLIEQYEKHFEYQNKIIQKLEKLKQVR